MDIISNPSFERLKEKKKKGGPFTNNVRQEWGPKCVYKWALPSFSSSSLHTQTLYYALMKGREKDETHDVLPPLLPPPLPSLPPDVTSSSFEDGLLKRVARPGGGGVRGRG